jgi:hypothetical protein
MVKGGEKAMTTTTRKKMGRPRLTPDEKLMAVTARMHPGDVEKLASAARRRGIPTGSEIRDVIHAALVLLDEPEAFLRAGVEGWRVELGLDQVPAAGARGRTRKRPAAGVAAAPAGSGVSGQPGGLPRAS